MFTGRKRHAPDDTPGSDAEPEDRVWPDWAYFDQTADGIFEPSDNMDGSSTVINAATSIDFEAFRLLRAHPFGKARDALEKRRGRVSAADIDAAQLWRYRRDDSPSPLALLALAIVVVARHGVDNYAQDWNPPHIDGPMGFSGYAMAFRYRAGRFMLEVGDEQDESADDEQDVSGSILPQYRVVRYLSPTKSQREIEHLNRVSLRKSDRFWLQSDGEILSQTGYMGGISLPNESYPADMPMRERTGRFKAAWAAAREEQEQRALVFLEKNPRIREDIAWARSLASKRAEQRSGVRSGSSEGQAEDVSHDGSN